jgi:hypothetical protein
MSLMCIVRCCPRDGRRTSSHGYWLQNQPQTNAVPPGTVQEAPAPTSAQADAPRLSRKRKTPPRLSRARQVRYRNPLESGYKVDG